MHVLGNFVTLLLLLIAGFHQLREAASGDLTGARRPQSCLGTCDPRSSTIDERNTERHAPFHHRDANVDVIGRDDSRLE